MSLYPGMRLGAYEIGDRIGAGGMGEVYRAHDTGLKRDVAIKVLPASVAADEARLARFRREAQLLAALNHPNIAAIYGIEESGATPALVMELVEGDDLSRAIDRVGAAGMPLEDAMPIARQIADALGAAHAQGVIHRDLKPGNIKLKGTSGDLAGATVKVLDFGLAKLADTGATSGGAAGVSPQDSPTVTTPAMTAMGMILGTAAYMAPEQARGRAVDKRADIWAFGCVLYEMLTGRRAFQGDDVSDTLAAVLRSDPDWTALPADTPPAIVRLLRRCLTRDPARRLADIADARLELDDPAPVVVDHGPPDAPAPRSRGFERAALLLGGMAVAALALAPWVVAHLRESPPVATAPLRVPLLPPDGLRMEPGFALSPDGRYLALRASRPGEPVRLWLRELTTTDVRQLSGTDNALLPVWSPDSRRLAFRDWSGIKIVDIDEGAVRMLVPGVDSEIALASDGTLLFSRPVEPSSNRTVLWKLSPGEREAVAITTHDAAAGDTDHTVVQFLPDGQRFLFNAAPGGRLHVGYLDGRAPTLVGPGLVLPVYAPPGYLMFLRGQSLMVQGFDIERGVLTGEPVAFINQIGRAFTFGSRDFSVSNTGVLVYSQISGARGGRPVWVDRRGVTTPVAGLPADQLAEFPRIAPDGRRFAFVSDADLWVGDAGGRPPIRVTFDGARAPAYTPLWTGDGRRLVFERGGRGGGLWSVAADGRDATLEEVAIGVHYHAHGWTPDGRELITSRWSASDTDIVALPVGTAGEPRAVQATPAWEGAAGLSLSPDGRWLAYAANPTGRVEIYVRPYADDGGATIRVSPDGGTEPEWSRDGRELFYRQRERLLAARVTPRGPDDIEISTPVVLFAGNFVRGDQYQPPSYDVAPDGRFLLLEWPEGAAPGERPLVVLTDWLAAFTRERSAALSVEN